MKAILILDEMPSSCEECPLCVHAKFDYYFDKTICIANGDKIQDTSKVQHMCPLKEMPQEKEIDEDYMEDHWLAYNSGWNACIEEIEKRWTQRQ